MFFKITFKKMYDFQEENSKIRTEREDLINQIKTFSQRIMDNIKVIFIIGHRLNKIGTYYFQGKSDKSSRRLQRQRRLLFR